MEFRRPEMEPIRGTFLGLISYLNPGPKDEESVYISVGNPLGGPGSSVNSGGALDTNHRWNAPDEPDSRQP